MCKRRKQCYKVIYKTNIKMLIFIENVKSSKYTNLMCSIIHIICLKNATPVNA